MVIPVQGLREMTTGTTWNPADITAGMALSGGDRIVTLTDATAVTLVRATTGKMSGKWYFEVTESSSGSGDSLGVALLGMTGTNVFSNTITNGAGIWGLGALNINGANAIGNNLNMAIGNGDAIEWAVDLDNQEIWSRHTSAALWNNDAGADPAANTGGKSIAAFAGQLLYPYVCWQNGTGISRTATLNAGQVAFQGTAPAGFTAGWPP